MDINTSVQVLIKSFLYGFILSGSGLVSFMIGYSVKSAFTLLNRIVK